MREQSTDGSCELWRDSAEPSVEKPRNHFFENRLPRADEDVLVLRMGLLLVLRWGSLYRLEATHWG